MREGIEGGVTLFSALIWRLKVPAGAQEQAELQPEEHARVCTAFESKLLRDQEEAVRKRGEKRGNQHEAAGPSGPRAPGQACPLPPRQGREKGFRFRESPTSLTRQGIAPDLVVDLVGVGRAGAAVEHTAGRPPHGAAPGLAQQADHCVKERVP